MFERFKNPFKTKKDPEDGIEMDTEFLETFSSPDDSEDNISLNAENETPEVYNLETKNTANNTEQEKSTMEEDIMEKSDKVSASNIESINNQNVDLKSTAENFNEVPTISEFNSPEDKNDNSEHLSKDNDNLEPLPEDENDNLGPLSKDKNGNLESLSKDENDDLGPLLEDENNILEPKPSIWQRIKNFFTKTIPDFFKGNKDSTIESNDENQTFFKGATNVVVKEQQKQFNEQNKEQNKNNSKGHEL